MTSGDHTDVQCERWLEAVSALVDGEPSPIDPRLVEAHLETCPSCRAYESTARRARRVAAITVAPSMPDLSATVTRQVVGADRGRTWSVARGLLAVVAAQIVVLSVPDVLGRGLEGSAVHDARHLGAFSIAYGVGLAVVVARPARARTMLPVAAVLAIALLVTAVVDLANGEVPFVQEAVHVPEVLSVALIWLLAVPAGDRARTLHRAVLPRRFMRVDTENRPGVRRVG